MKITATAVIGQLISPLNCYWRNVQAESTFRTCRAAASETTIAPAM